jgi:hypothetical protein
VALFPHQLYTDPAPREFDAHGLAFDLLGLKTHGALGPMTPEQRRTFPSIVAFLEGASDLQESIDSPAATAVKRQLAALSAAEVPAFFQNLNFASDYSHGTHVTGIALRGNPAARLVVGRITFDYKLIPTPPTVELERRAAADYQIYIDYFRAHHVRVVNMSWGGTPANDEAALEKNNIGKDATERKVMAAKLFAIDRAGLYAGIVPIAEPAGRGCRRSSGRRNVVHELRQDRPRGCRRLSRREYHPGWGSREAFGHVDVLTERREPRREADRARSRTDAGADDRPHSPGCDPEQRRPPA